MIKLKNSTKTTTILIIILFTAVLFLSIGTIPAQAAGDESQVSRFTFTVNGKIIKGASMRKDGVLWVDAGAFNEAERSLGAKSEFDSAGKIMTVTINKEAKAIDSLPTPSGKPFSIVLNGKIIKTSCLSSGGKIFVPFESTEKVFSSLGCRVEKDLDARLATVTMDEPPRDAVGMPSIPNLPNVEKAGEVLGDLNARKEKVGHYIDSLKKIFDSNKPNNEDQNALSSVIGEVGSGKQMNLEGINSVRKKYAKAIDEMKKLTPPDEETGKIHNLAIDVFTKMDSLVDQGIQLLSLSDGLDIPGALEKIRMLNDDINREGREFDERVKALRKKYNLGPQ
jgi:hypothetical protein